ncbi:MAG: regulatory protein GemA [Clostridia bacterium]
MTARQRSAIFAVAKTAGLDTDALHDVVRRVTGLESIALLSTREAIRVIDALKGAAGQGAPLGWLTDAQRGKIYALCRTLGWVTERGAIDTGRLEGFVRARFRIERLNWVPMDRAGAIIEALKSMAEGGRGARKGHA